MSSNNFIDFNNDFSYPLQWLYESTQARMEYQCWLHRVSLAMVGKPSKNLYKEELTSNINKIDDKAKRDAMLKCVDVPEGLSFALEKAVQNRASQMSGGVDNYQYQINDPFMIIEDDTEDLLAAKCEQDYVNNKLEIYSSTFSRDLTKYGVAAVLVKYSPMKDENKVFRIHPKNIWFDTMFSSTGKERFRGYSTMISWSKLKKMIKEDDDEINTKLQVPDRSIFEKDGKTIQKAKYGNKKIRTLNDLDIYVEDLNKLAASPDLQGYNEMYWEYDHDLRSCYNLNWYHTLATDVKAKTNSGYGGNDVELTVIYDLENKIEFKIINRRFVISANKKCFRRNLIYSINNPITGETKYRTEEFKLDCPLKFQFEEQESTDYFAYPISPLFPLLELHDQLCAWRSKRDHVSKILSILRIETNAADAKSLKGLLNIMGIVLDDINGDINSIRFDYDYTPIDSQIAYLEQTIMAKLSAYDQFDALQAMGDRASAAESGMALGAIAQGLSTHQNAIMQLYADIARQCIANRVAYSPRQEFPVNNLGDYSAITIQQMALDAIVTVKPKLAKKVQERLISTSAITLASSFKDVLTKEGVAYFIEQAMFGNAPRKLVKSFIKDQGASEQEIANAQLQAQNQAQMLQQNQAAYEQNPVPYEVDNVMNNYSPEEVDQIIAGVNNQTGMGGEEISIEDLQMPEQDGSIATTGLEGLTTDAGSLMANANGIL